MKLLQNKTDFEWYKKQLDVDRRYDHEHRGDPEKYPCKVESSFYDDPNGPYCYYHTFYYLQEIVCSECGHKETVWPQIEDHQLEGT